MGGQGSKYEGEIICPKCPLTPILSICQDSEGKLTCEYKCPFMHFGTIPFSEINQDKEKKHGVQCDICQKNKQNDNRIELELFYCGTCKQFICKECQSKHNKDKKNHKILVPKSKVLYTCLEHGKPFKGYCFTCLISICSECKRHEHHCTKIFKEFYPEKDFLDTIKYYINSIKDYYKSFYKCKTMNKEVFEKFKRKCDLLLSFALYLQKNFEEKSKTNKLNGETLINYLNICTFNYNVNIQNIDNENKGFLNYCKTHLILSNKPISDICTFSRTKSDYQIGKLTIEDYHLFDCNIEERPKVFKYSPIGEHVCFSIGNTFYFLGISEVKKGSKIKKDSYINSFNIINKNILCLCCKKIHLYYLIKKEPYYEENENLPDLDLFDEDVLEIEGDISKFLVIRTLNNLVIVGKDKSQKKYEIKEKVQLENINKTYEIEKQEEQPYLFTHTYYYQEEIKKTIKIIKYTITGIKGIWNDYIITLEGGFLTVRNDKLIICRKSSSSIDFDCLVHNGSVLVPKGNQILFYSIPNLETTSIMTVSDNILSINIMNRKTFIVIESQNIEQFELNTWKKISHKTSFDDKFKNLKNLYVIGVKNKLMLYDRDTSMFYFAQKKLDE